MKIMRRAIGLAIASILVLGFASGVLADENEAENEGDEAPVLFNAQRDMGISQACGISSISTNPGDGSFGTYVWSGDSYLLQEVEGVGTGKVTITVDADPNCMFTMAGAPLKHEDEDVSDSIPMEKVSLGEEFNQGSTFENAEISVGEDGTFTGTLILGETVEPTGSMVPGTYKATIDFTVTGPEEEGKGEG